MSRRRWTVLIVVAGLTFLPAINAPGWPRRWLDPNWIEAVATFWALLAAGYVVKVELDRNRKQFVLDVASVFATWRIETEEDKNYFAVVVSNFGRYPITDVTVVHFDYAAGRAKRMLRQGYPVPIGPGSEAVPCRELESVARVPLTIYFTSLGDGRRYRRRPDGRLDDLGVSQD